MEWNESGRKHYAEYVMDGLRLGTSEGFPDQIQAGACYGSKVFLARMRELMKGDAREQKTARQMIIRPDWKTVVKIIEKIMGEKWENFQSSYGNNGREMAMKLAREHCGMTLREIGAQTALSYNAAAQAIHRFTQRIENEPALKDQYGKAAATLLGM